MLSEALAWLAASLELIRTYAGNNVTQHTMETGKLGECRTRSATKNKGGTIERWG